MAVICRSKVTSCSFHNEIHHVDFFKNNNKSVLIKSAQHTSGLKIAWKNFTHLINRRTEETVKGGTQKH